MLACRGLRVTVLERSQVPGGKLRQACVEGSAIDCGPTVFTMREIFEEIFAEAGTTLAEHLTLKPATVLARHAWGAGEHLDLHADIETSVAAISAFAGPAEGRAYRAFCAQARHVYRTLDQPFIRAARPSMLNLMRAVGPTSNLFALAPFSTLWRTLGGHFRDPRLRQLFARYATYCGSSPFACPATLMLVAHVEQAGVWLVEGGMHRLAVALATLAQKRGVTFRYGVGARTIRVEAGKVAAVELDDGARLTADAVVSNADIAALAAGAFGTQVRGAVKAPKPRERSLSAVTFALKATSRGFPLARHNVFFSEAYKAEFEDIFRHRRLPRNPTVYVCAQDRDETGASRAGREAERLFCIVNAPPTGDTHSFDASEIAQCEARTFQTLERCGLTLDWRREHCTTTTPADFNRLYPATGGALYGAASHGPLASFRRPGVRSRVPGLYVCGGSTHPGPGLPMAALSGRMAALSLIEDWASMRRSQPTAMLGGISTA
ncbi:NAD(P)/FAD-dependent oxidoreductase [Hyphomicrobiales bacterium BP6-180914]|uniref:NAD(P)/FAD-dependent oxidoreductase n=2 Tax=Lichenifustis flavocetrariae TaxID=2949735 RepID=A0AA41YRN0_9HYPH|nr:NAD(P)/FAD-dependent oxidoreductase [Lichenifustis flavocetrariae]